MDIAAALPIAYEVERREEGWSKILGTRRKKVGESSWCKVVENVSFRISWGDLSKIKMASGRIISSLFLRIEHSLSPLAACVTFLAPDSWYHAHRF